MSADTQVNADSFDADKDPAAYTKDEIETFFHTANMLMVCIDQMENRLCPDHREHDRDLLLARAAEGLMMEAVFEHTTEEEFDALQAKFYGPSDDDDVVHDNHPGTPVIQ